MGKYTLYTYQGINELRKIQEERIVHPFIFVKTGEMLKLNQDICIDITALVYLLQTNKENTYAANTNLAEITEETTIIVDATVAHNIIDLLPFIFIKQEKYFNIIVEKESENSLKPNYRRKIYKYNNIIDLDEIIQYASSNEIPIATFSVANYEYRNIFEEFNKELELALVDLTSVTYAIEGNKALIYAIEQLLSALPNVSIISLTSQVDILAKYFPLFFEGQEPIYKLIPQLKVIEKNIDLNSVVKITDLGSDRITSFITMFKQNLIGHKNFKERFEYLVKNFVLLNKIKEQKILSLFLFGASGIGKTEVAKLIARGLHGDSYLPKINFQNYSSQDSLNILIGSPRGYIGCEHGELSDKINKSNVGILLCDEFEKATKPVHSFFLELLEEGQFTDSMAREYNMDGYIIVFTSNILNKAEYNKVIPPELQTRFDLVCEFQIPSESEKVDFLDLLFERAKVTFETRVEDVKLSEEDKKELYKFDYSSLSALRDIKRVFNNRLLDLLKKKRL